MSGSITYPTYPKDFNKKKRFFPSVNNNEINRYIRKGIGDIILGIKIGRIKDGADNTYHIKENVRVRVTYINGEFRVFVTEKMNTYEAPVNSDMKFDISTELNYIHSVIDMHLRNEFGDKLEEMQKDYYRKALLFAAGMVIVSILLAA